MRARFAGAVALAVAGIITLSCSGIQSPSNNQSETFPGTLQPQSANSHPFTAAKTGEFTVKLTAWAPNPNLLVGIAWTLANNDGSCTSQVLQQNNFSSLNTQALGGQITGGKYCIFIFDVGSLTAAQTYTVTVSHP
jgi:hypothetical protein